jgi:hypothetical protein
MLPPADAVAGGLSHLHPSAADVPADSVDSDCIAMGS